MTIFNWNGGAGEARVSGYIWVYFAATIHLTGLVSAIWWYFTKQERAERARKEKLLQESKEALKNLKRRVRIISTLAKNLFVTYPRIEYFASGPGKLFCLQHESRFFNNRLPPCCPDDKSSALIGR